ncbi:MAG: DUF4214 domain-containing protein [Sulfitobacter sp.]
MSNSNPEGFLVILGDAFVGETLVARPNGLSDKDGINYSTESFQWFRDGEPISGARSQAYVLTNADLGSEINIQYTYRDNLGNIEIVVSKPKPAVTEFVFVTEAPYIAPNRDTDDKAESPNNTEPTGDLVILGDAEMGETLVARPNSLRDVDGINYTTEKFQWFREDAEIFGATSQTYVVTAADQGTRISVEYSYIDGGGTHEIEYSKPKPTVPYVNGAGPIIPVKPVTPDVADPPVASENPSIPEAPAGHINSGPVGGVFILGFPVEDANLLARVDALYDRDNIVKGTGEFQWLRDGEPILGATGKTYTVSADDRGAALSVQYSYLDGYGTLETVVSDAEPPVPLPEGQERLNVNEIPDTMDTPQNEGGQPKDGGDIVVTPEDDIVILTAGMSSIDGLEGVDTAVLDGDQNDYTVTLSPGSVTITDRKADGIGTVELTNFEFLNFGTDLPVFNGAMDLQQFGGHTNLSETDFEAFVSIYIAYFNRAPDAVGLSFWGTAFANGTSLEEIVSIFADQPETLATYPADTSNLKFVADVYENVLGRTPDIEGLRFWSGALSDGSVNRGDFILKVLDGAKAEPPAGATQEFIDRQQADQAYLETKADLGTLFAVHRGMSNVDDASMVMAMFDGSSESLDTAVEAIDTLYAAAQDPVNGEFLMPLIGVIEDVFAV